MKTSENIRKHPKTLKTTLTHSPQAPMPTTRSHNKKSRCELHTGPQTMVGTIVSAQAKEDLRHAILAYLNNADLMNACLVSKGAYTATSTLEELARRSTAAKAIWQTLDIHEDKMIAKLSNSTNLLRDVQILMDIADHRQDIHNHCVDFNDLLLSVKAWSHLSFRWAAEKKVEEMAAVTSRSRRSRSRL